MKYSEQAYHALLAAVVGIPLSASAVSAQIRVDTAGHAMDANTQIGSGGYNSPTANTPLWNQYQNALVTNSDSGGYGFRGRSVNGVNLGVGYTDPFAFRGLLAGEGVDQFIAMSTGVPTMADPTASSNNYAAPPNPSGIYYGAANHVAPPSGFQQTANGQGFIPQQPTMQSTSDTRLGTIDYSGSGQIIPKPYEMILPGPVDPTADPATPAQQMLAANPIFGVVNWTMTPEGQQQGQPNPTSGMLGQTPLQRGITPQVSEGLTQVQLSGLRQQLINMNSSGSGNQTNPGGNGANALPALGPGAVNSSAGEPLSQVNSQSSLLQQTNLAPASGDVSTDQSSRQYPVDISLPPPTRQSAQYAKLRKSIDDYNSAHSMTDEQANRKFQQILRLRDQANVAAENGANVLTGAGPGAGAGAETVPNGIPSPEEPASPDFGAGSMSESHTLKPGFRTVPENMGAGPGMGVPPVSAPPVPIDDFAKDIPAKGLADLIAGGDLDVQKGQYDKAIAVYNQAIDVVPNNPLILVARAIAELGGGYYAQANSDLHNAISDDPAVLIGQYDLQKQFGEPRLKMVIAELKSIATSSPENTLHSFLLTFCYYNSHHVGQAAEWLQTTDRRSGGQDPAIIQMKKYWNFSDEAPVRVPPAVQPHSAVNPQSAGPAAQPQEAK